MNSIQFSNKVLQSLSSSSSFVRISDKYICFLSELSFWSITISLIDPVSGDNLAFDRLWAWMMNRLIEGVSMKIKKRNEMITNRRE